MPTDHAILAPSASKRWMACAPSARLEATMPQKDTAYTREGTIAHGMAESLLRIALKNNWAKWLGGELDVFKAAYNVAEDLDEEPEQCLPDENVAKLVRLVKDAIAEGLDPWEMMQTVSDHYCSYIWEDYLDALYRDPDAILLVEQRLKLEEFIPEGFGSSDAVIIYGKTLCVYDLKYGKGVKVSAEKNPQMMCYGLGALQAFRELYDIEEVCLTIIQPRLQWWSNWNIPADRLLDWGYGTLRPRAEKAFRGEGEYVPGDHCRFCSVAPRCKALAAKAATLPVGRDGGLMTNEEIAEALRSAASIKSWIAGLEAYALEQALSGKTIPGFKVVEGRSVRQISDPQKAMQILADAGFDEASYTKPKELKTITDLERLLKKKGFQELLGQYVVKPQGKPAIVPDDDPRPAMGDAKSDFRDIEL